MQSFSIILMFGLAAFVVLKVFLDDRAGKCRLVSTRNVFLAGFVFFQLISAIVPLWLDEYHNYPLIDPGRAGLTHAFFSMLFLVAFFAFYRAAPLHRAAVTVLPKQAYRMSISGFITLAIIVTVLGLLLRFGVGIRYVGVIAAWIGVGLAAAGCGLAAWVWAPRVLNPIVAAYASGIIGVNMLIAMWGGHGRRGMVTALAAILWGAYFSYLRHHSKARMALYFAPVFIGGLLFVTAYTSVRGMTRTGEDTAFDKLRYTATGDFSFQRVRQLLLNTDTGTISLWIHENIPSNHDYELLRSVQYFFLLPIPREIYPDKGLSLSTRIPVIANIRGARTGLGGLGVGPGVVGHASADGGWWVVLLYGCIFGWIFRTIDEWLESNIHNPFVVLAIGSPLGHLFAVPRGSTELFLMQTLVYIFGTGLVLVVIAKLLGFRTMAQWQFANAWEDSPPELGDSDPFEQRREERRMAKSGYEPEITADYSNYEGYAVQDHETPEYASSNTGGG